MIIAELRTGRHIECAIEIASKSILPSKREGLSFNWLAAANVPSGTVYVLLEISNSRIHGCMQLRNDEGMVVMEILELAPFNLGANKGFEKVAGCLIAFGCREAIKMDSNYKGFLTFVSKTQLINWYKVKYYATQAIGQRMYIDPESGKKLINEYLK